VRRVPRDVLLPALAGLILVVAAFVLPPQLHGDAGEYLLTLESFHAHRSPELQPRDLSSLRGLLQDAGLSLDESRVLPNYHRGRDGRLYCYHFWGYSLAGVPARHLLDALGLDPLRSLPLTNALLFALALASTALLPWSPPRRLALAGLLLFSPALAFLLWPHPEVLSFAFVATALALAASARLTLAILAAALAALQNPPLVLLVGLLWVVAVAESLGVAGSGGRRSLRTRARAFVSPSLAALPAIAPAAFFLWQFGVFNLSVRPNEAAESLSVVRALDLLFDPNLGLLPHAPVTVALGFLGALWALGHRRLFPATLVFGVLPLLMYACTANSNWNNDTSGPSRYVVWLLPLLAFVAAAETGGPASRAPSRWAGMALGLAVVTQAGGVVVRGGPLAPSDFLQHSPAARLVLDRWPALYSPAPEVFVERTIGHEGPFTGPVIYRDAAGRCRKAWVQWRHARALVAACGPPPGPMAEHLKTNARRRNLKRQWTWVDY
jgi:hypothetical protein